VEQLQHFAEVYGFRVLGAAIIVILGWAATKLLTGPLHRLMGRSRLDPTVAAFLFNSLRGIILFAVILVVLQQLGVETASLLTLLGATGLAVALSLQGSLANFASGLLVLSFRMVRVGDMIQVGDVRGRVTDLLPFHVVVVTADNQTVTIPNTALTNGPVRNDSALAARRVQWSLPLTASDDLAAVKVTLLARLRSDPRILPEPMPQVFVQDWQADKRVLTILAWSRTEDAVAVQQELLEVLGSELDRSRARAT
jgi:small conductance mechanosensitive channel